MVLKHDLIKDQKFSYKYRRGGDDWEFFVQTLNKGEISILPKKLLIFRYSKGSPTGKSINRKKWNSYSYY